MSKKVIELRFDAATEARIRALVATLDPSATLVIQPHLSLAVFDGADAAPLIEAAKRTAIAAPTDVRIAGVACGICGFNAIDAANGIAEIGYWLAASHQHRGAMTACVARLVRHAFGNLNLHRVTIAIAVENWKSRAVAERLGFRAEGTMRDAERLYDRRVGHVLYSRLRNDARPV